MFFSFFCLDGRTHRVTVPHVDAGPRSPTGPTRFDYTNASALPCAGPPSRRPGKALTFDPSEGGVRMGSVRIPSLLDRRRFVGWGLALLCAGTSGCGRRVAPPEPDAKLRLKQVLKLYQA